MQQILSTVRLQLEDGQRIISDDVLQLLDRDPCTGTYTCSWHENDVPCDWQGSQRTSRAEAHINNHLERRPYICDGTQCGSNNWSAEFLLPSYGIGSIQPPDHFVWFDSHAAFYSSEDLYAHQTRGNHVQCSKWYVYCLF